MKDQTGQKVPQLKFQTRVGSEWVTKTTDDYFKGKKVVLFALPGAYTPTCSSSHLPRYNELYEDFKKAGVDDVICLSVNDTFVMNAWKDSHDADNITMLPDGNGEFSEKLGFLVEKSELGFGKRSWRYSMLVEDGEIKKMFIEDESKPGDPFDSSDAVTMLKHLGVEPSPSVAIYTREGCPFCDEAKALLEKNGHKYSEHVLNEDYSVKTLVALSGSTSVPQVFVQGEKIGGTDELKKFFS